MTDSILTGIDLELQRYEMALIELQYSLIKKIEALPDNPKIKRISSNPNCFVLNFKDLENNWSAEYYDFKHQYKVIINMIDREDIEGLKRKFAEILKTGKLDYYPSSGRNKHYFHPDVVKMLREL